MGKHKENDEGIEVKKQGVFGKEQAKLAVMGVMLCAVTAVVTWMAFTYIESNKKDKVIPLGGALGTTSSMASLMDNRETEQAVVMLGGALEDMRGKNILLTVEDGVDSYVTMTYNSDGEAFVQASQTGYITVYRKDHKAIRFTDYIDFGYDSDVITMLENVQTMARNGKGTVLKVIDEQIEEGRKQYAIDIRGWERLAELYGMVDESFSHLMIEQLKASMASQSEVEGSEIKADDIANFRFTFIINEETSKLELATCSVYMGEKDSAEITWGDIDVSWVAHEYIDIYEWKLEEGWYTEDWENISDWENTEVAEKLLEKQYTDIVGMLTEHQEELGLTDENSEGTSDGTSDATGSTSSGVEDTEGTSDEMSSDLEVSSSEPAGTDETESTLSSTNEVE